MKRFRCLHDRVLVLPDAAPVKVGGLAQAPSQAQEPERGTVVSMGPKAKSHTSIYQEYLDAAGKRCLDNGGVRVGQEVQWARYAGRELEVNGVKHRLLRLEELDGVWEEVEG
jgi:co-chaperonin GroES (HSP10)